MIKVNGRFGFNLFPMRPVVGRNPVVNAVADGGCRPVGLDVGREDVFTGLNDFAVPSCGTGGGRGFVRPTRTEFTVVEGCTRPRGIPTVHGHETLTVKLETVAEPGDLSRD